MIVQFLATNEDISGFQVIVAENNTVLEVLKVVGGN